MLSAECGVDSAVTVQAQRFSLGHLQSDLRLCVARAEARAYARCCRAHTPPAPRSPPRRTPARPVARARPRADHGGPGARERDRGHEGRHERAARDAEIALIDAGSPVCQPRRRQAGARARHVRDRRARPRPRSTSARRPAASPTCCSSAAPARWSPSTSGHGQLDWRLRTDPRVVVLEHVNARFLEAD